MKKSNEKLLQIGLIVGGILVLFVAIVAFVFRGGGETQIVLHNIGECPDVMMIIRQADGGDAFTLQAGPGETDRVDVKPNLTYVYEIRFPAEADAANRLCKTEGISEVTDDNSQIIFDRGQIALPRGSTHDFNVGSAREKPATVNLNNKGECDLTMVLNQEDGGDVLTLTAAAGASDSTELEPDINYVYEVRASTAPNADGEVCDTTGLDTLSDDDSQVLVEFGSVSLEAGQTRDFDITLSLASAE